MGQPQAAEQNEPTTWAEEWAAAEAKVNAQEDGDQANEEQQHEEQQGSETSDERGSEGDGSDESEASGDEVSDEAGGEPPEGEGDAGGQDGSGRDGETSRSRGEQRDDQTEEIKLSRSERLKAFKAEAESLGLEYDGSTVTVPDRARFREEKRQTKQRLQSQKETFEAEMRAKTAELEGDLRVSRELKKAIAANDLDAVASLVGHDSWNHLSESALEQQLSPQHRELVKLKREAREREKVEAQNQDRQEEARLDRQKAQARAEYAEKMTLELRRMKNFKNFADDPAFVASIMSHQEREWDGEDTISLAEAAHRAEKDARRLYDTLHLRFGGRTASQSEKQPPGGAQATEKPARRAPPKTVSQREVADASADENSEDFDEDAWMKKYTHALKTSDTAR